MATNKRNCDRVNIENWNDWLCSTGYLYPKTDLQLLRFNKLYEDYDFKLKNSTIDVNSIIKGETCVIFNPTTNEERFKFEPRIEELKMVARKGEELPQHIIQKMLNKHKNDDKE